MAALRWFLPAVALAALIVTFVPAAAWRHPGVDFVQTGFDPNLAYQYPNGEVTAEVATVTAPLGPGANLASINLLATPLKAFSVAFDVTVRPAESDSVPFRIGVWSPWTRAGYFLEFAAGQNSIETHALIQGVIGRTLTGGRVTRSDSLGSYVTGDPYHIQIAVDKARAITVAIAGPGVHTQDSVTASDIPDLFGSTRVALTASALSPVVSTGATLTNYSLTLPHQRFWADKVDDGRVRTVQVAILVLAALLIAAAATASLWRRKRDGPGPATANHVRRITTAISSRRKPVVLLLLACTVYLAGNALLVPLGGHPFDFGNEKLYADVAGFYGPVQLYYLPNVVSLARIWGGVPYVEAAFPYEPVFAYLYGAIGWLSNLVLGGPGTLTLGYASIDYLIKAVNVVFGLADAALLYLILRQLAVGVRWSLVAGTLFLFNPAVWFSMSVWGQTHVISLFFVLAAVLMAEKRVPTLAWISLGLACLTRPQMLVFGVLLGIVFLRKFTWRQNLSALSWTILLIFLALSPLTLATSPSLPVDIMLNNFHVQEAGGNEVALTTVSQDAYSVWPLVTYAAHGASGLARAFTPSSATLVGSLTYQRLSQILTVAALLSVSGALVFRKRASLDSGGYLPLVALGITSFLMLLTGVVATHFLLALPFLLLCRRWMGGTAYFYVAAIWTVTTFVPMFGDMGVVISAQDYPLLAPASNFVTRFFVYLYSWDRFITVAVVANVCALVWLAFLTVRPAFQYSLVRSEPN
jgi:hypothetical protein